MNLAKVSNYIGRFAPSPTGSLHLGSLYAALASFLHAHANNGKWLLRIDDLDHYRNAPGASDSIIHTLDSYGLHWDEPIYYQSKHQESYHTVVDQLKKQHLVYPCSCSRKMLSPYSSSIYPGFCLKTQINHQDLPHSLRIKSQAIDMIFEDQLQGTHNCAIASDHGDFIISRKDHIIAYQLAVVIDDYQQNITHIVRGFDLLDSTPKQIFLQQLLTYPTPQYCHFPVITGKNDVKLSKQNLAQAVSTEKPEKTLFLLLELLNQNPPPQLKKASIKELLDWAIAHWQVAPLKKIRAIKQQII
ncbi:MAG: tRNA glutamyl-Q(34) synthetase GluQRS [Methylococcales bacterium]|nr:tRNA glutamyl-Q(34) synthetase GluQRS [Methylococcales bacterium]